MSTLDAWFPYESYRPHQQDMLEAAAACARDGGIMLVDAPTGSGKSSVVASLLSEAKGRKVLVAVRTVSQLNTFLRELELIRNRQKGLKYSYLIGKGTMCPMACEGNIYHLCEGLKSFSTSLMRERAGRGSLVPARDPFIRQQIQRISREKPIICPYFIHSRVFIDTAEGLKMAPSATLRAKAEQISSRLVFPDRLLEYSGDVCPYELMLQAAREADVVLFNFHHLFDEEIRGQIYQALEIDEERSLLLVDEAHNCGDVVQNIQSVSLEERILDAAVHELSPVRTRIAGTEAIIQTIPIIRAFMEKLKHSWKHEDWFDPHLFSRQILARSLYGNFDQIIEELLRIRDTIRERNVRAGDFRETATDRLLEFFYRILLACSDESYLTVYRRDGDEIALEVRSIDPAPTISRIAAVHACAVFISGTLSPVRSFRRYYFDNLEVKTLSLPNAFPRENRMIFCATDITSAYSKRRDPSNRDKIQEYIETFAELPGNLAVYFPSYEMLNSFTETIPPCLCEKEVFIEPNSAGAAQSALNRFLSLPMLGESGILFGVCGGKWSEGLDYRGELLGGALVIGLPLAPFTPVRQMVIDYFRKKFGFEGEFISYTLPALNRALQALGRVLRTPDDRGFLVLGEARFLEPRVRSGLPGWIQEELIPCTISEFSEGVRHWR